MPRLLTFAPCEKVIIDQSDSTTSLITIFDAVNIAVPPGADVPLDAFSTYRWHVFTRWLEEPGDRGQQYEQSIHVVFPDGKESNAGVTVFGITKRIHQITVSLDRFPIGLTGEYNVVLSLRKAGGDSEWQEIIRCPVIVSHITQSVPEGEGINEQE